MIQKSRKGPSGLRRRHVRCGYPRTLLATSPTGGPVFCPARWKPRESQLFQLSSGPKLTAAFTRTPQLHRDAHGGVFFLLFFFFFPSMTNGAFHVRTYGRCETCWTPIAVSAVFFQEGAPICESRAGTCFGRYSCKQKLPSPALKSAYESHNYRRIGRVLP